MTQALVLSVLLLILCWVIDIRTWHSNVEQHASEGVNKILIGNKCDWTDKKVGYHNPGPSTLFSPALMLSRSSVSDVSCVSGLTL